MVSCNSFGREPSPWRSWFLCVCVCVCVCVCACAHMYVRVIQPRSTLCSPMNCGLPGSSVHGILQQEYWSGSPFPSLGDLPDPGIKSGSSTLQADSLPSKTPGKEAWCPTVLQFLKNVKTSFCSVCLLGVSMLLYGLWWQVSWVTEKAAPSNNWNVYY